MSPPVLLIIFKRPEHTRRVLGAIRQVKPSTVLVAADGPRTADEALRCAQTRDVIASIDWDCTVLKNYSDENLGCGIRVYTAIDWALSQFEDLVILEDDCIPNPSFFPFCEELLEHYRNDERVMHISGNNFQAVQPSTSYGYYFSKYTHAWGWATWRRAWKHFDWSLRQWPELKSRGMVQVWCDDPPEQKYWTEIFDRMHEGAPDVWDYQWNCSCWAQNGLTIIPAKNLVSNIGVGPDATHTKDASPYLNRPTFSMGKVVHPPFVTRDWAADSYTFAHNFGGAALKQAEAWRARVRRQLGPILWPLRAMKRVVRDARRPKLSADR